MNPLLRSIQGLFSSKKHRIDALPILVLLLTTRCNCRCRMCQYWKEEHVAELSIEDLKAQMESLRRLKTSWILLSGGEALLHAGLWDICTLLKELPVKISLSTNGLLLKKNAAAIVSSCDEVIVSLDGSEPIHDRIRGVPGAFKGLEEGIRALKELRPYFRITARCVVQKDNFSDLHAILDSARTMHLDGISFLAADVTTEAFRQRLRPGDQERNSIILTEEQLPVFREILLDTIRSHRNDFESGFIVESPAKLKGLYRYFAAMAGKEKFPSLACNAPWVSAVIEPDGTILPCFFHAPYGSIHEDSLQGIINSPGAIAFRRQLRVKRNRVCRKCVCPLYVSSSSRKEIQSRAGTMGKEPEGH